MAKRRQSWTRLYDSIRVVRMPDSVYVRPATDAELDEVEAELGSRLPHSYREFMKRFGPGELQSWVRLNPITPERNRWQWTVTGRTKTLRDYFPKHPHWHSNHQWLASLIYFAANGGGAEYAWDPAAVTRTRPHECRFYYLPRHAEDHPVEAGRTFAEFIEWVDADVRSWSDSEVKEDGPGMYFNPLYLRAKKPPLKRDVNRWLVWDGGTVQALAHSIREGGREDSLSLLADALEEAGCTNADMLDSCRRGIPDVDGKWVVQVLLGKE